MGTVRQVPELLESSKEWDGQGRKGRTVSRRHIVDLLLRHRWRLGGEKNTQAQKASSSSPLPTAPPRTRSVLRALVFLFFHNSFSEEQKRRQ